MQRFENQLCDTVDQILLLLGQAPPVPNISASCDPDLPNQCRANAQSSRRRGPKLIKSQEELVKLIDSM